METTERKYIITNDTKTKFVSLVLINEIINFQHYFPVVLTGNDDFLGEYLVFMKERGLLDIQKGTYVPTDKGRKYLVNFYDKYYEYLKMFDIYCAVDLAAGEFSFSHINDDMTDAEWNDYINNPRFSDIRIAVAEFKKIDPIEIVFMSFLNEGRFDTTEYGWQHKLARESVWQEIEEICNSAIKLDYLLENDVIQDVVTQGSKIVLDTLKMIEDDANRIDDQAQEEVVETTTTTETVEEYVDVVDMPCYGYDYYGGYYDPYYISPLWLAVFIL